MAQVGAAQVGVSATLAPLKLALLRSESYSSALLRLAPFRVGASQVGVVEVGDADRPLRDAWLTGPDNLFTLTLIKKMGSAFSAPAAGPDPLFGRAL